MSNWPVGVNLVRIAADMPPPTPAVGNMVSLAVPSGVTTRLAGPATAWPLAVQHSIGATVDFRAEAQRVIERDPRGGFEVLVHLSWLDQSGLWRDMQAWVWWRTHWRRAEAYRARTAAVTSYPRPDGSYYAVELREVGPETLGPRLSQATTPPPGCGAPGCPCTPQEVPA